MRPEPRPRTAAAVYPGGRRANVRAVPRRVLMTADAVGGVWHYSLDLSAALIARGMEVTIAVMGPPPDGRQRITAANHGIRVLQAPFRLEWMPSAWEDVDRAADWLLRLDRTLRPDVVHLNGFCHADLPWQAPTLVVGHSCVCSWWNGVHGTDAPSDWDEYRARVARGLAAADLVVSPSAAMLAALDREYGAPLTAARVIPNGRACVGDAPAEPPPKDALVFAAGRIWDDAKNIESLCAVAPCLPWPVYLAGDTSGPGGGCANTGYVRHLGRLDEATLGRWFTRAAIYALPARYEPFGLSVLEAAAAGCALVLGDIVSLRENWSGAAVFVPPDNRPGLASAMQRLIADPEERHRLGRRALLRARQFTLDRMADEYARAYALLTAERGPEVRDG